MQWIHIDADVFNQQRKKLILNVVKGLYSAKAKARYTRNSYQDWENSTVGHNKIEELMKTGPLKI